MDGWGGRESQKYNYTSTIKCELDWSETYKFKYLYKINEGMQRKSGHIPVCSREMFTEILKY